MRMRVGVCCGRNRTFGCITVRPPDGLKCQEAFTARLDKHVSHADMRCAHTHWQQQNNACDRAEQVDHALFAYSAAAHCWKMMCRRVPAPSSPHSRCVNQRGSDGKCPWFAISALHECHMGPGCRCHESEHSLLLSRRSSSMPRSLWGALILLACLQGHE